uniref:Uncharacterized protein n=1 Tax=Setaria italica TaxID=4555 RepID=K3Y4J7_SETIT
MFLPNWLKNKPTYILLIFSLGNLEFAVHSFSYELWTYMK